MLPDGGVAMFAGQHIVELSLDVEAVVDAPVFGEVVQRDLRVALRAGQNRIARDHQVIIFGFPQTRHSCATPSTCGSGRDCACCCQACSPRS